MTIGRLAVLALVGCATATPALRRGYVPERNAVAVAMTASQAEAFRRTAAAFAAEGLAIENGNAEAGFLVAAPVTWSAALSTYELRYRASVTAIGSSVEVALTLTLRETGAALGEVVPGESPARPADVEPWRRLQRIADRLRTP